MVAEQTISRVAFITGAGQGLGAAIARALHDAGHRVALLDIDKTRVDRLAGELGSDRVLSLSVDVRERASIEAAVRATQEHFGPIDILVNNAALTRATELFDLDVEEWDDVLNVNLRSILLTAQTIAKGMCERGWGRIINLSSLAGQRGGPQVQGLHYAASKAGIIGATRYLAYSFASSGVTVNAIAPGPILTEATALAPKDKLERVASEVPLNRLGKATEIGALAVYLVSDEAGFMTGMTLDVNGGLLMR